jgi:PAS domain S-box-containing protein
MSGYSRDELLARDIFCVSSQMDRTEWPQRLERIRANEPLRVEMVWEFAGGKLVPVEFSMSVLTFGGNDYICVIGRPITEPERAARVMAARALSFAKYPEKPAVP